MALALPGPGRRRADPQRELVLARLGRERERGPALVVGEEPAGDHLLVDPGLEHDRRVGAEAGVEVGEADVATQAVAELDPTEIERRAHAIVEGQRQAAPRPIVDLEHAR